MKLLDAYPLITTDHLQACRDFYVRHFGFEVGFDSTWFVWLQRPARHDGEVAASLAFLSSEHPSSPPGPECFDGRGMLLTLQVADARAMERDLLAAGVEVRLPLRREPWGQLRMQCVDPTGVAIDVVEQVEPDAGWWDRYVAAPPAPAG